MLGVDVGDRWIGLAVGEGRLAVPLTVIEHENRASDVRRIAGIAREQEVARVVVGLPLSMSGEESAQTTRARAFGAALERAAGLPVVYHDERLSSVQVAGAAGRRMTAAPGRSAHPARRRAKPRTDDLAAAVILQAYIDMLERPS